MEEHKVHIVSGHDVNIIRPKLVIEDFKSRGEGMPKARLKAIGKALRTLHSLETMAVNIYRFQLTTKKSELNRQFTAAMCNEMTHLQDFQVKLYEYGFRPSVFRFAYWMLGFALGSFSKVRGMRAMLRTGIWAESKAVEHYALLLDEVDWDKDTRNIIEKDAADEQGHIDHWQSFLDATGT